jgi:hypothetical protein
MITINVIDNQIVGSCGEEAFTVPFTKELYEKIQHLAEKGNTAENMADYTAVVAEITELTKYDASQKIQDRHPNIYVQPGTGKFFLKNGDVVSSVPMPKPLVDRIYDSMDKDIDFDPLIKMWVRWMRNPILHKKMKAGTGERFSARFFSFVNAKYMHPGLKAKLMKEHGYSEEVAAEKATIYQMKITAEGLLNGYKVSKEILEKFNPETGEKEPRYKRTFNINTGEIESDGLPEFVENRLFQPAVMGTNGDPFWCIGINGFKKPGHFIRVGCVHRLDSWDQVNTNDEAACVKGLHVGGLIYINNYSGEVHNIFVDPMHIGAVPEGGDGAIRCIQYFVHSSLAGVNGSIYHSSKYANMTDAEWNDMRTVAIAEMEAASAKIEGEKQELTSL